MGIRDRQRSKGTSANGIYSRGEGWTPFSDEITERKLTGHLTPGEFTVLVACTREAWKERSLLIYRPRTTLVTETGIATRTLDGILEELTKRKLVRPEGQDPEYGMQWFVEPALIHSSKWHECLHISRSLLARGERLAPSPKAAPQPRRRWQKGFEVKFPQKRREYRRAKSAQPIGEPADTVVAQKVRDGSAESAQRPVDNPACGRAESALFSEYRSSEEKDAMRQGVLTDSLGAPPGPPKGEENQEGAPDGEDQNPPEEDKGISSPADERLRSPKELLHDFQDGVITRPEFEKGLETLSASKGLKSFFTERKTVRGVGSRNSEVATES